MKRPALIAAALLLGSGAFGKPVKTERVSSALEFSYLWPARASQIRGLHAFLQADMEKMFKQASKDAAEDVQRARAKHYPFRQHSYSMSWDSEGETPRLISLEGSLAFDTNGAHPNSGTKSLLWDQQTDRQTFLASLFGKADQLPALTRADFCHGLDAERARRRDGEKLEGEFAQCPAYKELAIVLVDRNHNHRFDHISFVASPYVAGPYVEGEYDISLAVSPKVIAALKPEFRKSFEVQRQ